MTREEYVNICNGCSNRGFDPKQGVVCGLTQEKANFEESCAVYEQDEKYMQSTEAAQVEGMDQSLAKDNGSSDMLYGALWCIGGIIATVADFGYIFWGAIVFGAIQFIRGVAKSK